MWIQQQNLTCNNKILQNWPFRLHNYYFTIGYDFSNAKKSKADNLNHWWDIQLLIFQHIHNLLYIYIYIYSNILIYRFKYDDCSYKFIFLILILVSLGLFNYDICKIFFSCKFAYFFSILIPMQSSHDHIWNIKIL